MRTTKNIVITGAAISGNQGAALMAHSVIESINASEVSANFALISHFPDEDLKLPLQSVRILDGRPLTIFPYGFALAIVWRFFPFLRRISVKSSPLLKHLAEADLVLDVSGISFSTKRKGPFIYDAAILALPLVMKKRVVKLSQAYGPVYGKPQIKIASKLLNQCELVFSRGEKSTENLLNIGVADNVLPASDLAFLNTTETVDESSRSGVLFIPSEVVKRTYEKTHGQGSYVRMLSGAILLVSRISSVRIASFANREGLTRHNNDSHLAKELSRMSGAYFEGAKDHAELIKLCSESVAVVTGRFHGMIASAISLTPALATSWGHKYREVIEQQSWPIETMRNEDCSGELIHDWVKTTIKSTRKNDEFAESVIKARQKSFLQINMVIDLLQQT